MWNQTSNLQLLCFVLSACSVRHWGILSLTFLLAAFISLLILSLPLLFIRYLASRIYFGTSYRCKNDINVLFVLKTWHFLHFSTLMQFGAIWRLKKYYLSNSIDKFQVSKFFWTFVSTEIAFWVTLKSMACYKFIILLWVNNEQNILYNN